MGHKSIIYDIIPITYKGGLETKSRKKVTSDLITSFTVDINDFIIGDFSFSLRKRMEIPQIEFKEISISFSLYHDDFVDEKYLGEIFKFE